MKIYIILGLLIALVSAQTKLGVWWNADPQRVHHFESYLGGQIEYVRAANGYLNANDPWWDFVSSASWFSNDLINPNLLPRQAVWSVALFPENGGYNLQDAADGDYNSYYYQLAQNIHNGRQEIWIIPGYEYNGWWFAWTAGNGKENLFVQAYQNLVDQFRLVHPSRFKFVLGAAEVTSTTGSYANPELCYPGDDYVDAIGCNFYVKTHYTNCDVEDYWNDFMLNPAVGLRTHKEFADSHNKPFWIPELGFNGQNPCGSGELDITFIIDRLQEWILANDVKVVIAWDGYRQIDDSAYFDDGILGNGMFPILDARAKIFYNTISSTPSSTPAPTPKPTPKPTSKPTSPPVNQYANVYDDQLNGCWYNITYETPINYRASNFKHSGSYSAAMNVGAWLGMYLQCTSNVPLSDFNAISFWVNGGASADQKIRIKPAFSDWTFGTEVFLQSPPVNSWLQYTVSFSQFNLGSNPFRGFMIQSNIGTAYTGTIYIDDIKLIKQ